MDKRDRGPDTGHPDENRGKREGPGDLRDRTKHGERFLVRGDKATADALGLGRGCGKTGGINDLAGRREEPDPADLEERGGVRPAEVLEKSASVQLTS
jgi:hypothetical protein